PAFYNATKMLFEALRRAGTTDVEKVRDQVEKLEGYDAGVYGPLKWTGLENYGVNHQINLPFFIVEVKNGKRVLKTTIEPEPTARRVPSSIALPSPSPAGGARQEGGS